MDLVVLSETATKKAIELGINYGPKLILAVITLIIGLKIVNAINSMMGKALKGMDDSLRPFLIGLVSTLLKVVLIIAVAGMVGIETTSFVAVLGAAGLAVGMALQGSLGNFAGSVLILIFRPFKVGDLINAQGQLGVVKEISIFCTLLNTGDNRTIIIPNGALAGGTIENLSSEALRRVDMEFGIGYGDSIDEAKQIISDTIYSCDKVLKDPACDIFVSGHGDSAVMIKVRPWCKKEYYWDVYIHAHEQIKKNFDANKISIPFPQRDIHVHQVNS